MVRGHTIPSIARLTESTAIQDAAATPPPAAISHYTLFTNQGIKYPFAAAGGLAKKRHCSAMSLLLYASSS